MALLLLLAVPACQVRLWLASGQLRSRDIASYTGVESTVTARNGEVLSGSGAAAGSDALLGNLLGNGTRINENTLLLQYGELMIPDLHRFPCKAPTAGGRQMVTTLLPAEDQQALADAFGEYHGCIYAYNYVTGEILTMLSLPCASSVSDPDDPQVNQEGWLINRCLRSEYIPGSTMKVVTTLCAILQDQGLMELTYRCEGKRTLSDGTKVTCAGGAVHGEVGLAKALGKSCNCYFSYLTEQLDPKRARESLARLGFTLEGDPPRTSIGRLLCRTSSTAITTWEDGQSVWAMVGQGASQINVVEMTRIAAAAANFGKAARPRLVECIRDAEGTCVLLEEEEWDQLLPRETAILMEGVWGEATRTYYTERTSPLITHAKTGTAQQGGSVQNRLLLGAMQGHEVAFMIVVEGLAGGDNRLFDIANTLAGRIDLHFPADIIP